MACMTFQRFDVAIQDKDDSKQWMPLKQLKEYNLLDIAEFSTTT